MTSQSTNKFSDTFHEFWTKDAEKNILNKPQTKWKTKKIKVKKNYLNFG